MRAILHELGGQLPASVACWDDAFYITTPGIGTALMIKKGSSVIQMRVYGFPVDQIKEKEKTLAQDAVPKL
jgi:hypothetical protein